MFVLMKGIIQWYSYIVVVLCSFFVLFYSQLSFYLQLNHYIMAILGRMPPLMILLLQI